MPRTGKSATRKCAALSPSPTDSDASSTRRADEREVVQPKPKKARAAVARVKGRRGAMSAFTNIPLDLLYDICFYLEPRDLLALSTTSKVFRSVVTGASSGPLWVAARERVGLPELERPMTDLQYAHLFFGKGCSFCSRKNAGKPEVYYRARICTACMKDKFAYAFRSSGSEALDSVFEDVENMHPFTLLVANHTAPETRHQIPRYCLEEIVRVSNDLHLKFPEPATSSRLESADKFLFVLCRTSGMPRSQAAPTGVHEKSTPFERWWFAEREEKLWAKHEDAIKLRKWIAEQQEAQMASKESLREQRRKDIVRRFKDQGFVLEEFDFDFNRHSLTNKPELLTERTWTTVEATLKPILLASRSSRRRRHFEGQIAAHQATPDASALAAYYPGTRFDLSSLSAWQGACTVDGFVKLDELWASHKDAIINELDELVRSHIEAMLRALADAHAEAVSAQERDDADDILLPAIQPSSITLPALPSFLPRTADEPIVATDEQLVEFLTKHPLSLFVTSCCGRLYNGESALRHASTSYCNSIKRVDIAAWALCNDGGRLGLKVDGKLLLRGLYLKDLLDSTALVPTNDAIEGALKEHGLDAVYPLVEDRLVRVPKCACGTHLSEFTTEEPLSHIYKHLVCSDSRNMQHTVTVDVGYTLDVMQDLYLAEIAAGKSRPLPLRQHDLTPFDDPFDDPYGYGSDDSEFDSESGPRDDCCVM